LACFGLNQTPFRLTSRCAASGFRYGVLSAIETLDIHGYVYPVTRIATV